MTPAAERLEIYEKTRERRRCSADLNAYFTAGQIAGKKPDRLAIGPVSLPPGEYETVLAVVTPDGSGDCARYAAARVRFSDAGLACICDRVTRDAHAAFEDAWRHNAGVDANPYESFYDYFDGLMAENYREHPQYRTRY